MTRKIVVTSALPYANGPIHIGHLVEYLQTDIWVRFQKLCGNTCYYFCADDTHGTPVMIRARSEEIEPEQLIARMQQEHLRDFTGFKIAFDNYYSTHSEENRRFSEMIYQKAVEKGAIHTADVEQAFCEHCKMWLPDRYIKGTCPRCKSEDQYGDSCDCCGAHYRPTELVDPYCSVCKSPPIRKNSKHYFFRLADFEPQLKEMVHHGYVQESVRNKLEEWFQAGLRDWDISRDGPYFGFKIPGEQDKYFYVWLDAPIGYMASCQNYCQQHGLDFDQVWDNDEYELYHFIGKDIMYFHALFWPALLLCAGIKTANKLFVHGFLTVNGQKMSKTKGTFITAETYLRYLNPEYLRYYYACKLSAGVDDIDLNFDDFLQRVNSDLVGKFANLASRSGPMLTKKLQGRLGSLDQEGRELINKLQAEKEAVISDFEGLNYASAIRRIVALADEANRYVDQKQPWTTIKDDPETTRTTLTAVINAVRILTIYLKPVVPVFAEKIEVFLNIKPLTVPDVDTVLEEVEIGTFKRLVERVEKEKVQAMVEESKENAAARQSKVELDEPLALECTYDDFMKVDLRIARVSKAEPVEGADKLLALELDLGALKKNVFAGIAKAYKPEELVGKMVVCVANLQPRKMRFGVSEGMILAAGPGNTEIFMLSVDPGAEPGQRVR
ncbi:MAG: methionine--tRNA ligase [Sedimentisphaerales bacterium]|nr:methionine--tRNA ligase [Sedimentisphaerales bacterium]